MLSQNDHHVTVFINDKKVKSIQIEKKAEARIIRFNPDFGNATSFLGDVTALSYAFAEVVKMMIEKEGSPDVIESQDYNGIGYFLLQSKACLASWCKDIPVVITMHSPSFLYLEFNQVSLYKRPNFWIGEMERFCIQAADLLISPSQYLIDELKKRFVINNTEHVLVNPYKFNISEKEETIAILNNELTFYGKLSPQKGTFKILEQFKSLWDKGFSEPFTMIGGQDIVFHPAGKTMGTIVKKKYKDYIKSGLLKLKKEISPAERESFLSGATVFIVPSIVDNLPYVVLELMSLGKVVIVSRQGGQVEIVSDGIDGFVFDYEEPGSFEKIVKKVLSLPQDKRNEIGKLAVEKIRTQYGYDKVYSQKIKLLDELRNTYKLSHQFPFIRVRKEIHLNSFIKTNDLLSVVIPFFNLGKYIEQTVASILNSTYPNIEILIINDGSTDPVSIQKLELYRNHKKIKVIDKSNGGLAATRNAGAEMAAGTFLAFLDADDMVSATYYEKAIRILKQYENVHFVGAWTQYFGDSKAVWPTFNPEPPLILTHNTINSSALVYKKNIFLTSGKNDMDFKIGLEDYESVVHMKSEGFNGVAIPEILFNYRVRKNSMIKGVDKRIRADYYNKIASKHKEFFLNFNNQVSEMNLELIPLSFDNATLDDFPFQHSPVLNKLLRKVVQILKANPYLKKVGLVIKRMLKKQ